MLSLTSIKQNLGQSEHQETLASHITLRSSALLTLFKAWFKGLPLRKRKQLVKCLNLHSRRPHHIIFTVPLYIQLRSYAQKTMLHVRHQVWQQSHEIIWPIISLKLMSLLGHFKLVRCKCGKTPGIWSKQIQQHSEMLVQQTWATSRLPQSFQRNITYPCCRLEEATLERKCRVDRMRDRFIIPKCLPEFLEFQNSRVPPLPLNPWEICLHVSFSFVLSKKKIEIYIDF